MWLSDKTACLVCEVSKSKPLYYKTTYSINLQSFTEHHPREETLERFCEKKIIAFVLTIIY